MQYKWIAGKDPGGSPIFEVLSESDRPMTPEEIVEATGYDLASVNQHLAYGVANELVKGVSGASAEQPSNMTDYLLGGKRTNEQDEKDIGDLLGRNVGL